MLQEFKFLSMPRVCVPCVSGRAPSVADGPLRGGSAHAEAQPSHAAGKCHRHAHLGWAWGLNAMQTDNEALVANHKTRDGVQCINVL